MVKETYIAMIGAGGRMGRNILQIISAHPGVCITGLIDARKSPCFGKSIRDIIPGGGLNKNQADVVVSDDVQSAINAADVLIDFSSPAALPSYLSAAALKKKALIIGTTGYNADEVDQIHHTAKTIPVCFTGNFSIGINTMLGLVYNGAKVLQEKFDTEIIETHHNKKKDAPSGTALMLAGKICSAWGKTLESCAVYGRQGITGERKCGELGIHSVRGGGVVGDHIVQFLSELESLTIQHTAFSREAFASGVLSALLWITKQPPGLYSMLDVLGFSD